MSLRPLRAAALVLAAVTAPFPTSAATAAPGAAMSESLYAM
jgi:hypothetical protein